MEKKTREMFIQGLAGTAELEKAELRQVNLNVNGKNVQCFITSKRNDTKTGTTVSVISVFADETYDVLEMDFIQNSLKTNKVRNTTFEYLGPALNPKVISEREFNVIDINKFTVDVEGFYVPLSVILTPYFKEKAKNAVFMTAIRSLELVDDKRFKTIVNENKNNRKYEVNVFDNINISLLDEKGNEIDLNKVSNKKIKDIVNIGDNKRYMDIISNKNQNNNDGIEKGRSRMENVIAVDAKDKVIIDTVNERICTTVANYKDKVNKDALMTIALFNILLSVEEFNKIEQETMFGTIMGIEIENGVVTPEGSVLLAEAINKAKNAATILLNEEGKDEAEGIKELIDICKIEGLENAKDKAVVVEEIFKTVESLTKGEEKEEVESIDAEIITDKSKIEQVVDTIEKDKKVKNEVVSVGKAKVYKSTNKIFSGMVKYIHENLGDDGLVKYGDTLTMIHDLLSREALEGVAKFNKDVKEVLYRYNRDEIENSLAKGLDMVNSLLTVLSKQVVGYENLKEVSKLPIDMKVKLVYLLMGNNDAELSNMSIEDKALFYIILRNGMLSITVNDMVNNGATGEFSLARARVSVRNREIVKQYIA